MPGSGGLGTAILCRREQRSSQGPSASLGTSASCQTGPRARRPCCLHPFPHPCCFYCFCLCGAWPWCCSALGTLAWGHLLIPTVEPQAPALLPCSLPVRAPPSQVPGVREFLCQVQPLPL